MRKLAVKGWGEGVPARREQRSPGPGAVRLLAILDLSGSMKTRDAGELGSERRVDVLRTAWGQLTASFPVAAVGFNDNPFSLQGVDVPEPRGLTELFKALDFAGAMALAVKSVVLVSDGEPTDARRRETLALVEAWRRAGVVLGVIYCGPGGSGEEFMRELARAGGGQYNRCQVKVHELVQAMTVALLEGPSKAIQL